MASVSRFAFLALALVSSLTSARPFPEPRMPFTRRALTPIQAQVELGPLLSTNASIFGPNDTRWHDATERYNTFTIPHVQLVVQPGMEEDIPEIVSTISSWGQWFPHIHDVPEWQLTYRH